MTWLLFPGRHHLLTNFQQEYLTYVCGADPAALRDVDGRPLSGFAPVDTILWAVTSANHSNTRRNPLPSHRREAMIEDFADQVEADSFVYMIDDVGTTGRFAEYVLKKIAVDSNGRFRCTPENTVVGCSTPAVIALYEKLGFRVLPVELADRKAETFRAETPWQLLQRIVAAGREGRDWRTDEAYLTRVSRATRRMYRKYDYGSAIVRLHTMPILTEDGDITETRDYNTYVRAFDEGADRKYALIRDLVVPGRIADIGCCTGGLIAAMTRDDRLRESDFYGIEIARRLYAECLHRKEQGAFANENVFFYQANIAAGTLFPADSINTFTTFALTHEIESYQGRPALTHFMGILRRQLALGGRWINVDVVGPDDGDRPVLMRCNREDGRNDDWERDFEPGRREQLRAYLDGLSTHARFLRFARDFRHDEGYRLEFEPVSVGDRRFVRLGLRDACEFLSKKDYTDNWASEMHEAFCFWSFADWKAAVGAAGFRVHPASRAYTNPWLVENRYRGRVELFDPAADGAPAPLDFPVTNMVLVAERT
jgi:hypothetical protein